MPRFQTFRPDSEDRDRAILGYVLANRINDIVAKPDSKRYKDYLALVSAQWRGEQTIDHDDQYREQAHALVPRALDAYMRRDGTKVDEDRVYFYHDPVIKIAAVPHAIERDFCGITVHVRQKLSSYKDRITRELDNEQFRHAQAMMLVTQCHYWMILDYYEDPEFRRRKLHDRMVEFDRHRAEQLEEDMYAFLLKSRRREVA